MTKEEIFKAFDEFNAKNRKDLDYSTPNLYKIRRSSREDIISLIHADAFVVRLLVDADYDLYKIAMSYESQIMYDMPPEYQTAEMQKIAFSSKVVSPLTLMWIETPTLDSFISGFKLFESAKFAYSSIAADSFMKSIIANKIKAKLFEVLRELPKEQRLEVFMEHFS